MKFISSLLKIQNQLRVFHWQTPSYAQHKAFGGAYEELDGLIDSFIETYTGKTGRNQAKLVYNVKLDSYADNYLEVIDTYIAYLVTLSDELDPTTDTDLLNIRDEMLASLNKLKYLLALS